MKLESNLPIYTQIIAWVKDQIVTGKYTPGYQLPSRRQLAKEWKVNPNTVQKAFKEMEDLGMIVTQPQRPSTITEDTRLISQLKYESIDQAIENLVDVLLPMDLQLEEVIQRITHAYQIKKEALKHD
ncbi:GntR family transcriptional regulator [Facklamia miroungae]|uniref:DNA-binding transcriptional regulator YhcF, GntR family n=1 Tax=Facklamia miroungae TaxID=120956 RepID=A0A1G7TY76_9LACT|nr:GntR family transcriptional regulator [Facklamia miroungae]NKZ30004.1 GntR family transcriptional regulator [Facklamia miroungae]SDG39689.1 DNA-binding transcriptional regulator YhcF, GntR family [Facklamia miroungae]